MVKNLIVAAVIGAASAPLPVAAGPDVTTQHLLDDAATMLDLGMLRLEMRLAQDDLGSARYAWSENRILIESSIFLTGAAKTEQSVEAICAGWLKSVRFAAGVNADGKAYTGNSDFSGFFRHYGVGRVNAPKALYEDLDELFVLKCGGFVDGVAITISAPLLGKTYAVERNTGK